MEGADEKGQDGPQVDTPMRKGRDIAFERGTTDKHLGRLARLLRGGSRRFAPTFGEPDAPVPRARGRGDGPRLADETRYRDLVEQVPVVFYQAEAGADGRWLYVSPRIVDLVGFTAEEWMSDPHLWFKRIHPDDKHWVLAHEDNDWHDGQDPRGSDDYRLLAKDGRVVWVSDQAGVSLDDDGCPLYWSGVLTDITEDKAREGQLARRALHDPLTGLANRALLVDRIGHAVRSSAGRDSAVAVLLLDLDDFKTLNDGLGREAGDELLKMIGERLQEVLEPQHTLARLGGDEFCVLVEGDGPAEATRIAGRVVDVFTEPFLIGGREVFSHASVGLASAASERDEADELIRNAEVAMYLAKRGEGAGVRVFEPHMHAATMRRLQLKLDLQRAIDQLELSVHYQPCVNLASGKITGVEALARWTHPLSGSVPPLEFIPLAEETGLIIHLGRWILNEACDQATAWQVGLDAPALTVAVNLSARQLSHPGLVEDVDAALARSGLDPALLTLEITESVLMVNVAETIERLEQLKALGVRLAVDDFGTGYSSLNYLARFPLDVLKIDKSFVDDLPARSEGVHLAGAIVKLGQSLELELVAEGIEHVAQRDELLAMGCREGQGFLFAKALPPAPFEALFRAGAGSSDETGPPDRLGRLARGLSGDAGRGGFVLGRGLRGGQAEVES
ncbi:hypothetical protein BH18ACT15_BH18ACT15_04250 [soil metagenome]